MKKEAIIFDFDNTIEDFLTAEAAADAVLARMIAKKYRISPQAFLSVLNDIKPRRIHKNNRSEEFSRILWTSEALAWLHIHADYDFINAAVDEYWKTAMRHAKLFPGTKEVLTQVKKTHKLGLLSDSDGNPSIKQMRLARFDIVHFFDAIVVTDETGLNKPNKKNLDLLCKKLAVKATSCIVVGDSPFRDLSMAKKLGMTTVWNKQLVPTAVSYPFVDFTIKDIRELPLLIYQNEC